MGSPKTQTVKSSNEPWNQAKPYYGQLYSQAQQAFSNTNRNPYRGDLYANPNDMQKDAVTGMAGNQWGYGAGGLRGMADDLVSGLYLRPETNPYLQGNVDAALGDVSRHYTQSVLPQMGDAAIRAGAYGGSRQGIMEGLAAGEYSREANEAALGLYGDNYQRERDRQLGAGSIYNQANSLEQQQLAGLGEAGATQQSWDQGQLDADLMRYNMNQQAPWAGFSELLSVLTGGNFQNSTTTGPNPNYVNPLQMIMGLGSAFTGIL